MSNKKGYEQEKISMKDSKKMIVGTVLYALLYIGIIYASLCLGYIHPFFWVYASLVSSVFASDSKMAEVRCWNTFCISCGWCLRSYGRGNDFQLGIDFADWNTGGYHSLCNR